MLTRDGTYVQRFVYRAVSPSDRRRLGNDPRVRGGEPSMPDLTPRSPTAPRSISNAIAAHVLNETLPSNFVSTTTVSEANISNRITGEQFNTLGYVKVDLLYISPSRIVDISTRAGANRWGLERPTVNRQGFLDALHTREVLISGGIAGEAIEAFIPL